MYTIKGKVSSIEELCKAAEGCELVTQRKYNHELKRQEYIDYLNIPCSFDTESTSTMTSTNKKFSFIWCWQLGINGAVFVGRTIEELQQALKDISKAFGLHSHKKMVFYVHNLQHDYQLIRKYFRWTRIFAREERSVIEAEIAELGIVLRCSYYLTGCSLEHVGKNLTKYRVEKAVGDLDYDKVRHYATPYTEQEEGYLIQDCLVVMSRIQCEIEEADNRICDIPLTKTGKVRSYCRKKCLNNKKYKEYIHSLTLTPHMYEMCKRAFMGGFTHASWLKSCVTYEKVASQDFTSAYPACMLLPVYPCSTGERVQIKDRKHFDELKKKNCVIFNCTLRGVKDKFHVEHYLSSSKCWGKKNVQEDNGRVVSADELSTSITELDLSIIEQCYDIDEIEFGTAYIFTRGYLPKELIECVLDFYEKKTTLKGLHSEDGSLEAEYALFKEMLNSVFGCSVTDCVNDTIYYDNDGHLDVKTGRVKEWGTKVGSTDDAIDVYNRSNQRFLYYPWGIYITAANRRNLWSGIFSLDYDYIYSDTDSLKYLHPENHVKYFEEYNEWITAQLRKTCAFYSIDEARLAPLDVKGKPHPLGVWDYETKGYKDGCYQRFKTLGAKRYLVEYIEDDEKHLVCTVSGINKRRASKWLSEQKDPFDTFSDQMTVPEEDAGRNILTYIDDEISDVVTDYLGNTVPVTAKTGVHFSRSDYNLTLSPIYIMLLGGREKMIR